MGYCFLGRSRSRASWETSLRALVVLGLVLVIAGCGGRRGRRGPSGPPGTTPGDGLAMEITSASASSSGKVVVRFRIDDGEGTPLDLSDLDRDPRFALGWIHTDPGSRLTSYRSHILRTATGRPYSYKGQQHPPALASATQATTDSGGTFERIGAGAYKYTFGTVLPAGYERDATHTVAAFAHRGDRTHVVNPVFHFVPSGGPPQVMREVVQTGACNECHDPITAHGEVRREVGLCQLCHTAQTVDPETGNTMDFAVLSHRLHSGPELTRLPYLVVGYQQEVHDFSTVIFPQETRNCVKCHTGGAQADHWKTKPSRAACGDCHDEIDFATGANHNGVVQTNDNQCLDCHPAEMEREFDLSTTGGHVIPYESSVNPRLALAITDVQNMVPAQQPRVRFTIANSSGPVEITTLDRVAIVFGGPASDYTQLISLSHRFNIQGSGSRGTLVVNGVGDYTYAPDGYLLPTDATGTWSVALEARTRAIQAGPTSLRFGANNPVAHIDVLNGNLGGGSPVARRRVVDEARCNSCHRDLIMHGNLRTEIGYCVLCHNTWATDELQRPGLNPSTNPPESIHFKLMIHRIHKGEELENPYTVYGFGRTAHDFTEVRFPGDLRNCEKCHLPGTQHLPLPAGAQATVVNIAGVPVPQVNAVRTPATAACTGCHDGDDAFTHTRLNSIVKGPTSWSEACSVCHREGAEFGVGKMHER